MSLISPVAIGSRSAPSRVLFGPHETNLGWGRSISERHAAYYGARADGGAGVIITEAASVHASDWPYERAPLAEVSGAGWAEVARRVRPAGTLLLAGLNHAGGQGVSAYSQRELWAPSRVPEVNTREVPKWMEVADIAAVVDGFARAAEIAVGSGCDGVEINAGQHSLIRQFLSGLTNHRSDQYAQGTALLIEVLTRVRACIGDGVVALRLCVDELAPWAGITPSDAVELATELGPLVDLLTCVRGSIYSVGATRVDMHEEPGYNIAVTAEIRGRLRDAGCSTPVCVQGSIVEVDMAAGLLADGAGDLVEMTRAQIADPGLVSKVRAGEGDRIRPCVLCNQRCTVRDARNPIVSCVMNPVAGYEAAETPASARDSQRVVVVGGGPAGLEAARFAAERGHEVELHERSAQLGGSLRVAALASGRHRWNRAIEWWVGECQRLGVTIRLQSEFNELPPNASVIVATGSIPRDELAPLVSGDSTVVMTVAAALLAPPSSQVVAIWDPIGGPWAVSAAETLAGQGVEVHLVTPDAIAGNELARSGDLAPANSRLQALGVALHRRCEVTAISAVGGHCTVDIRHRFSRQVTQVIAGAVIDGGAPMPDDAWFRLYGEVETVRVGDCVAPRTVYEAVLEAQRAVLALEGEGDVSDGVPMGSIRSH